MQLYVKSERLSLKTILFFTAVVFIAFLPIASFLFFLKNDAFTGYFPPKFFMSESLHAGYLPLWNPYINFGFPQYGDMSGGYWNPITWIVAATVGYNAYSFTIETLFYIIVGGLGMYQLLGSWQLHKQVSTIGAVAFMCCGYIVGHLQHFNWLSGAAFMPWCFWSYLLLLESFSVKKTVLTALLFYMLGASAHPGISISTFYFFIAYVVYYFFINNKNLSVTVRVKSFTFTHSILLLTFLIVSAGMITGYADILPHFVRGEKISLQDSLLHPTNLQSWLSALLPFATVKNESFFNNDISVRNCYFSLTLLLFFLLSVAGKKSSLQKFLVIIGLLFALLSAGGIFKTLAYGFIPFIGYVRLNGEFRIFAIFCFILVACFEMDKYIQQKKNFTGAIQWIYYAIEILLFTAIVAGLYKAITNKESLFNNLQNIKAQQGISLKLKSLIDAISFYDTLWIQGFIQLMLLWGIKWCFRFKDWSLLKKIVVIDMVLACLINIPFTGVGKASVAQVQSILNRSPKGIPKPQLSAIIHNDTASIADQKIVGDWSMYNKHIGTPGEVPYPIILKNMRTYFDKDARTQSENYLNKPFIFIADSTVAQIKLLSFSPQKIEVDVLSNAETTLVLQQNFYPHWYYTNGKIKSEVNQYGINFMSVPIVKGANSIRISFEPTRIKYAMLLSAIAFIICSIWLIVSCFKPPSPSSQPQ